MTTRKLRLAAMATMVASTAVFLGYTGSAAAQDGNLANLLNSGNGQITAAQAEAAARAQFNKLDTNHDGVISESEFVAERMKLFNAADANGDGVVTRAEIRSAMIARLQSRGGASGN